jgi:pimeloyl-ACP methyl ester carboxylesterase
MLTQAGMAQISQVISWQDPLQHRAYEPMPTLCLHGIASDSAATWTVGVSALSNYFSSTYFHQLSATPSQIPGYQPAAAYVETFDYGIYNNTNIIATLGHEQTFDSIRSNAWHGVYVSPFAVGALRTLSNRVDEVRRAYVLPDGSFPRVILLAHSMGGVVSHYYLCQCEANGVPSGVARLITLGTPHYGSTFVNWQRDLYSPGGGAIHFARHVWGLRVVALQTLAGFKGADVANFAIYANAPLLRPEKQGMTDLTMHRPASTAPYDNNPLTSYFNSNAVPGDIEYVVNSYTAGLGPLNALTVVRLLDHNFGPETFGDAIVPKFSQEGRSKSSAPADIYAGATSLNVSNRPVVFAGWEHAHTGEAEVVDALKVSLDGVPYQWWDTNSVPAYALPVYEAGEMNAFRKCLPQTETNGTVHTDEPGIDQMQLTISRSGNPLLVAGKDTYNRGWGYPIKEYTNQTDLVGHQIITDSSSEVIPQCTIGVKNRSETPVNHGDIPWIKAGNEYLPASQTMIFQTGAAAIAPTINAAAIRLYANLTGHGGAVDLCLVQLDATNNVLYQYGYYKSPVHFPVAVSNAPIFFASQGANIGDLVTPQVERAFNTPVDSATVVDILRFINGAEGLSNACHSAIETTRWSRVVNEWIVVPSNGVVELNFFPTTNPTNSSPPILHDAWTNVVFTGWTYDVATKTVTVTNVAEAPSHLLATYTGYLGCAADFTTNYDGTAATSFTVPLLADNALAGVSMDAAWLAVIRSGLELILDRYRDTYTTDPGCVSWTLPTVLAAAEYTNTTWTPVVSDLVTTAHFTELSDVVAQLTTERDCCIPCPCPDGLKSNYTVTVTATFTNTVTSTNLMSATVPVRYADSTGPCVWTGTTKISHYEVDVELRLDAVPCRWSLLVGYSEAELAATTGPCGPHKPFNGTPLGTYQTPSPLYPTADSAAADGCLGRGTNGVITSAVVQ